MHTQQEADLPLLCERHTTSKIACFEDLASCQTFGFRGEALASMSFVARLSVTTMPAAAPCALRATFTDGVLDGAPKPCAGVPGTSVCVEDLFYNVVTRRKALKSGTEEYTRVLDVVQRYACLRTEVAFSVRKQGEARSDLHAPAAPSRVERVRTIFGNALARELLPFSARTEDSDTQHMDAPRFELEGLASGPAYGAKRSTFIIFINGRLVECNALRRALEAVYVTVLPKADRPWVFLSARLPPSHVDVNVHPTKAEVAFLHTEELVTAAASALQAVLEAANNARSFTPGAATASATQQGLLLPGAQLQRAAARDASQRGADSDAMATLPPPASQRDGGTQRERAGGDHKLVRTDARAGRLDAFLQRPASGGAPQLLLGRGRGRDNAAANGGASSPGAAEEQRSVRARHDAGDARVDAATAEVDDDDDAGFASASPAPCELTSVCELRAELGARAHGGLVEVLRRHTFVGMATGALALLQHGTKLYLASVPRLSRELFVQLALQRFGCAEPMLLSPPAPVEPLLLDALSAAEAAGEWTPGDGSHADVARLLAQLLAVKGPMLKEYFALDVGEDGTGSSSVVLRSLPLLCDGYTPDLLGLPEFLLRLGNDTDWEAEKPCFADVAKHLGELYVMRGPVHELQQPEADTAEQQGAATHPRSAAERSHEWAVAHVLLPALRQHFHPPAAFATDGTVLQVACLEQLYRVFERC
jgi:DNA mismatch repair protein MLH1